MLGEQGGAREELRTTKTEKGSLRKILSLLMPHWIIITMMTHTQTAASYTHTHTHTQTQTHTHMLTNTICHSSSGTFIPQMAPMETVAYRLPPSTHAYYGKINRG